MRKIHVLTIVIVTATFFMGAPDQMQGPVASAQQRQLGVEPIPFPFPFPQGEHCFDYTTISSGQHSGFGNYCNAPIPTSNLDDARPIELDEGDAMSQNADPGEFVPCHARVAQPAFTAVIRNVCAWQDLWNAHVSYIFPQPPAPEVDFEEFVVVAVVAGPRPNGCYSMGITRITNDHGMRKIHVVEYVPCNDPNTVCTQVITNAHHFIKVCKDFLPPHRTVCFENRYSETDCTILGVCP